MVTPEGNVVPHLKVEEDRSVFTITLEGTPTEEELERLRQKFLEHLGEVVSVNMPYYPALHYSTLQQCQYWLENSLKPEQINGTQEDRERRIRELLSWFGRLQRGEANGKWMDRHLNEVLYYLATQSYYALPVGQYYGTAQFLYNLLDRASQFLAEYGDNAPQMTIDTLKYVCALRTKAKVDPDTTDAYPELKDTKALAYPERDQYRPETEVLARKVNLVPTQPELDALKQRIRQVLGTEATDVQALRMWEQVVEGQA